MPYHVRQARPADLEDAIRTEEAAMKGSGYLRDTAELFLNDRTGPLLVAELDGTIVGVAKYTLLPDHSAWLETLRVHPDHQRRGVGRLFYETFTALSREKGVSRMGMYTGVRNVASAALARQFGLETAAVYRESTLALTGEEKATGAGSFAPVDEERACALLSPLAEQAGGFLVLNRTFCPACEALYRELARRGLVLEDASGNVMVLGNRFLPRRSLQIGWMAGDRQVCLDHAKAMALTLGVPAVTVLYLPENRELQELLEQNGYRTLPADLQTMWGAVKP